MVAPIMFTNCSELREFDRLRTGCLNIDILLRGGFPTTILNEIVGCSGSGKTQICLVLSLMVQLPKELGGLNKGAVYICTENVFPVKRLHELCSFFQKIYGVDHFMDNVFIRHITDYDKLMNTLDVQIISLTKFKKIGIIIIDSIAGIFRSDNLDISYHKRSKHLLQIGLKLKKLGIKMEAVIICLNQVTDNIKTGETEPCLGLAWSNLVNNRFFIKRQTGSCCRNFAVTFSSDLMNSECSFRITEKGLENS